MNGCHKIPLIIDAEDKNAIENFHFIRNKTVDDILNLQEWSEHDLDLKILFLQKYKNRTRELEKKQKEEITTIGSRKNATFFKKRLDILISFRQLFYSFRFF